MQRPPLLPQLPRFVTRLWSFDAPPSRAGGIRLERILPTGAAHLIVRLDDAPLHLEKQGRADFLRGGVLSGVHAQPYRKDVSRSAASVGAVLAPGAIPALFGVPADRFAETHVPLDALIGRDVERLADQLFAQPDHPARLDGFERWLADRLPTQPALSPRLLQALTAPDAYALRASELANRAALSPRRFSSVFREAVGIAPKRWIRLQRFQRVLERATEPTLDWSSLACDVGYSDQAHLVREFRAFADMTPSTYRRLAPPSANHVPLPSAAGR